MPRSCKRMTVRAKLDRLFITVPDGGGVREGMSSGSALCADRNN
jgi:hypothetical protein